MARQRINPEGTPDRVFQPVATPVNLYYQPNLSQVELARTAQIINAFKEFSPQLERFTSDIVAVGIQKEKEIGAMEAMQDKMDPAKIARAIEGAGGVNPWRYETYLDTMGRRAVREKYQAALYQNMDDLSALSNPDGTLRGPEYVQQRLSEEFAALNLPQSSYFITRAALDEKAKVDSQFLPAVQARHTQRLKEQNIKDAKDEFAGLVANVPPERLSDTMQSRAVLEIMEKIRRADGSSGAEAMVDSAIEQAAAMADAGEHEEALAMLRAFDVDGELMVGGRKIGASFGARINAAIDQVENKRNSDEAEALRNRRLAYEEGVIQGTAFLSKQIQDMAADQPMAGVSISEQQVAAMAKAAAETVVSRGVKVPDDMKESLEVAYSNHIRSVVQSFNQPKNDDPNTLKYLLDQRKTGLSQGTYSKMVWDMASAGSISAPTAIRLTTDYSEQEALFEMAPKLKQGAMSFADFFGTDDPKIIQADRLTEVGVMVDNAQEEVMAAVMDDYRSNIMQLPEEQQRKALNDAFVKRKKEVIERYKADQKELLERADMRRMSSVVLSSEGFKRSQETVTLNVLGEIGADTVTGVEKAKISGWVSARVSKEFDKELQKILETGVDSAAAVRELSTRTYAIYESVLSEVLDPNNTNVIFPIRQLARAQAMAETGARPLTEAERAAGVDPGLQDLAREIGQMSFGVPTGTGFINPASWFTQSLAPGISEFKRQSEAASRMAAARDPKAKQAMEQAKTTLSRVSNESVSRMFSVVVPKGSTGDAIRQVVPVYSVEDGVLRVWNRTSRSYQFSPEATGNYLQLKGLVGFDPEEISSGMTKDGVAIDYTAMDPRTHLLVQSSEQLFSLINEYQESGETGGVLASWIEARAVAGDTGIDIQSMISSQARLLRQYVPGIERK